MNLEQRVELLEQELELLKNQIKATLLDIQETVLTQTHPSLRSESSPAPQTSQPQPPQQGAYPNGNPAPYPNGHAPQAGPVDYHTPHNHYAAPSPAAGASASTRRVSFDALDDADSLDDDPPYPRSRPQSQSMPQDPESLEQWAREQLKKNGVEATRQLVARYADQGRLSERAYDHLMHYIDRYVAARRKRAETQRSAQARTATGSHPAVASKTATPAAAGAAKKARGHQTNDDQEGDEHKSVILRLIAGVYNAGAGIKWSKDNG